MIMGEYKNEKGNPSRDKRLCELRPYPDTVYRVESGNAKFIIAGDFLHVALVQFPHPEISASYDIDQKTAAASRRQILDYAAANKIPIGGMHIVYPGVGNVEYEGNGFRFMPARQAENRNYAPRRQGTRRVARNQDAECFLL